MCFQGVDMLINGDENCKCSFIREQFLDGSEGEIFWERLGWRRESTAEMLVGFLCIEPFKWMKKHKRFMIKISHNNSVSGSFLLWKVKVSEAW